MFIIILDCYAPSFCFLKIKQTEHIYDNRYSASRRIQFDIILFAIYVNYENYGCKRKISLFLFPGGKWTTPPPG